MKITTGIIAVIVFGFVAIIGLIAYVSITGHDAVAFVTNIGGLLTALATFIVLIMSLNKQGATIDTIKTQTNGTLTKLTAQLTYALAKLDPAHAAEVLQAGNTVEAIASDVAPEIAPIVNAVETFIPTTPIDPAPVAQ